jgi:hypothetical protein
LPDGTRRIVVDRESGPLAYDIDLAKDADAKSRIKDAANPVAAGLFDAAEEWHARTPKRTNHSEKPAVGGAEKSDADAMLKEPGYVEQASTRLTLRETTCIGCPIPRPP